MSTTLASLASQAVAAKTARLLAAAAIDLPDVVTGETAGGIVLTAPGLRGRAFGTRTAPRDPRLVAFVEDHR